MAKEQEMVEATLKKGHRHKGVAYRAGDKIQLTQAQSKRLSQRKVI